MTLRDFVYWSTLAGIFSVIIMVHLPVTVRLFDVIMIVNLVLMSWIINLARVPRWIILFMGYLAVSGAIGILRETDTLPQAGKETLGISVSLLYFYYFFRMIEEDYMKAFLAYTRLAFWFAVIAFPIWVGQCFYYHRYDRLKGLTAEPASFCELVLPAFYWYAYQFTKQRKNGRELAVILAAIVLSSSSLGYLGVGLGAMLLLSGRKRNAIAIPVVASGLLALAYNTSSYFRERADDMLITVTTQDVGNSNLSTYATISNVFVTAQVLKQHPWIGNGIGSHVISHARYIDDIPGVQTYIEAGTETLNATEAASLALRSLSEFGILGFLGLLVFIVRFRVSGTGPAGAISSAILVNFIFKLGRDGNYFPTEQFFFIFIYLLNHRYAKSHAETSLQEEGDHTRERFPAARGRLPQGLRT